MSTFKVRGIVIHEASAGESNKYITILAKDYGKMILFCKGAQNVKSKFLVGSQLFAYSDFVVYEGNGFNSVTQIDILETFSKMGNDFAILCYGNYFLEICNKTMEIEHESNDIMLLLLKSLKVLENANTNYDLAFAVFTFKYLQLSGYSPILEYCYNCGGETKNYFSSEGLICSNCVSKSIGIKTVILSDTAVYTIKYIIDSDLDKIYKFTVDDRTIFLIKKAAKLFLEANVDVRFRSLEVLGEEGN